MDSEEIRISQLSHGQFLNKVLAKGPRGDPDRFPTPEDAPHGASLPEQGRVTETTEDEVATRAADSPRLCEHACLPKKPSVTKYWSEHQFPKNPPAHPTPPARRSSSEARAACRDPAVPPPHPVGADRGRGRGPRRSPPPVPGAHPRSGVRWRARGARPRDEAGEEATLPGAGRGLLPRKSRVRSAAEALSPAAGEGAGALGGGR